MQGTGLANGQLAGVGRLPESPGEITREWLNWALRETGLLSSNGCVDSVEVSSPAAGFGAIGSYAHIRLRFAGDRAEAPEAIFAKFSSGTPMSSILSEREIRFYGQIAPLMELRIPRCYLTASDKDRDIHVLLLEELIGGRPGDSLLGCSRSDSILIVEQLAGMHARWQDRRELQQFGWLKRFQEGDRVGKMMTDALPAFRDRWGTVVPEWAMAVAERGAGMVPEIFRLLAQGPMTLVHGDPQPDNMFFDMHDCPFALFDWQLSMAAQGAWDFAWFLVHSLPVGKRRAHEEVLLSKYHRALTGNGVRDCPLDRLREQIDVCLLFNFLVIMHAATAENFSSQRGRELLGKFIQRNVALLEDHDVQRIVGFD